MLIKSLYDTNIALIYFALEFTFTVDINVVI